MRALALAALLSTVPLRAAAQVGAEADLQRRVDPAALLEGQRLSLIIESWLGAWVGLNPVEAGLKGFHPEDDTRLDVYDNETQTQRKELPLKFLERLKEINREVLGPEDRVDLDMFRGMLLAQRYELLQNDPRQKQPQLYLPLAAIHNEFFSDWNDYSLRATAALWRLRQLPGLIAFGKEFLRNPPRIWVEETIRACDSAQVFFKRLPKLLDPINNSLGESPVTVNASVRKAMAAVEDYKKFLQALLSTRDHTETAMGEEALAFLLGTRYQVPLTPRQIRSLGKREYRRARRELKRTVKRLNPDVVGRDRLQRVMDIERQRVPKDGRLLQAFEMELTTLIERFDKANILPPSKVELLILERPSQLFLPAFGLTSYLPVAPFDRSMKATIFVPLMPDNLKPETLQKFMRSAYNRHEITVSLAGDTYPGKHLLFEAVKNAPRKIRRFYSTPFLVNGWAHYAEELAYDSGMYRYPHTRLFQLWWAQLRAARAFLAVDLHTGKREPADIVEWLQENLGLPKRDAETEVLNYSLDPFEAMSYTVGKVRIEELRDKYMRYYEGHKTLKDFHVDLLKRGMVPLSMLEHLILLEP